MNHIYGSNSQHSGNKKKQSQGYPSNKSSQDLKNRSGLRPSEAPHVGGTGEGYNKKPGTGRHESENAGRSSNRRTALTAIIVNAAIAAVMLIISYVLISSPESREIYTNFLFLPVSAFTGGFISFILNKNLITNAVCSMAVYLIIHLVFVEFSLWALLWTLFYMLNAFIGFLAGLIVRTFR